MPDVKKYLAEQRSREAASDLMRSVAGVSSDRPCCLVTSFAKRSDVPETTLLVKMSPTVERNLRAMGLSEPVSIRHLSGKWWIANVDASFDNPNISSGGCMVEVIGTTEHLATRYASVYCEFTNGPFGSRDEIDGHCLVTSDFDRSRLGPKASVIVIPGFSARWLTEAGFVEPFPVSQLLDKWWVCGLGGGVHSTIDLVYSDRMVTDGPYDTREKAEYQFDCLWEA